MTSTHHLIVDSKVRGQTVFSANGDKLGKIADLMIDKKSGKIAYALMSFDGFLGAGERYYPVPWAALNYNTAKHAYVVPFTHDQIAAGHHVSDKEVADEIEWREMIHNYYSVSPYW